MSTRQYVKFPESEPTLESPRYTSENLKGRRVPSLQRLEIYQVMCKTSIAIHN